MEDTQKEEITNQNILKAIHLFAQNVDARFDEVKYEIKGELNEVKGKLKILENKMVNGFSNIRTEIAEVRREIIARIEKLEKRDKENTDALTKNYLELETRVKKLEQQLQQLQPA